MFLDIGIGILLLIGVSWYFNFTITLFLVMVGVLFVLLPDIDFLWFFIIRKGNISRASEHRKLLHHPILFIPIGILILLVLNKVFATLFFLAILWHFVNDTIGLGWGVQWLWPFSKRWLKIFAFYHLPVEKRPRAVKLISFWDDKRHDDIIKDYDYSNWIKEIYFSSPMFAVELFIFVIAIIFLIIYVR